MAWRTPKTDWSERYDASGAYIGDWFGADDYLRIKENLAVLHKLTLGFYPNTDPLPNMPDVTVESFGYASTIDALERSIDTLLDGAFNPGIPGTKTWLGNAPGPRSDDLNRIEGACATLYASLSARKAILRKLSFKLGGGDF